MTLYNFGDDAENPSVLLPGPWGRALRRGRRVGEADSARATGRGGHALRPPSELGRQVASLQAR